MFFTHYNAALKVLVKKPVMLWGLSLLLAVVTAVGTLVTASIPFLCIAVGYLFTCGAAKLYMDGLKGKEVNSKQLFAAFDKNCVRRAGAMAWKSLWSLIWGCVPVYGIIKGYSYRFVPYIVMSHPEVSAFDALKISMKMTKGKKLQMWLADLIFYAAIFVTSMILTLFCNIPYVGLLFIPVMIIFALIVAAFSNVFVGLYGASFFNEEELMGYLAPEAPAEEA